MLSFKIWCKMEERIINLYKVYNQITDYCDAIYMGGSRVDPVIENPHDYDYICFAKTLQRHHLYRQLMSLGLKVTGSKLKKMSAKEKEKFHEDFSQVRVYPYTQISWFSYLDILMKHVVGKEVCPKTDVIVEHRKEFIVELKNKAEKLQRNIITNKKRWYHILRGVYILINNSYEVTEEQKREINILHDVTDGWEEIKEKTIQLLNNLE